MTTSTSRRKAYIPLESNPELFTELIHRLGVSKELAFHDVLSLEDPDLLGFVPRPALALVLTFPAASPGHELRVEAEERDKPVYEKAGDQEDVVWFRQTIYNACGLYGILHAISNGQARNYIEPGSHMARLLEKCEPLKRDDRARALEDDEVLEAANRTTALQGDTEAPASAEDEVEYHYVCFVKSHKDGVLYELDGDRKGPLAWAELGSDEDDLLGETGLHVIRQFVEKIGNRCGFSLLALAPAS